MIRFFIALALLLVPSAALAQEERKGYNYPVPVRYEYVYDIALRACPRLEPMSGDRVPALIVGLANQAGFTDSEITVLLNYCLMWEKGANSR